MYLSCRGFLAVLPLSVCLAGCGSALAETAVPEEAEALSACRDADQDLVCDSVDSCYGFPNNDWNSDGECDSYDDTDRDGCADSEDPTPSVATQDSDGDGFADECDMCTGDDFSGDSDNDTFCDNIDSPTWGSTTGALFATPGLLVASDLVCDDPLACLDHVPGDVARDMCE